MQKTTFLNKEAVPLQTKKWYVYDASEWVLGKLAVAVANRLRGKDKATYTPNVDNGDYVIIINAGLVQVSKDKKNTKLYYHHSGYIGGIKKQTLGQKLNKNPKDLWYEAVRKMLPKSRLSRQMLQKLFVYSTSAHQHAAQNPIAVKPH